MELTDLELIQRIAEIEGLNTSADGSRVHYKGYIINPLVDCREAKSFCFDLMVKYKIDFNHAMFTDGTLHRYEAVNTETGKGFGFSKNPRRAICLAIIEAKAND